ncbi:diguanylate cyclase/phosphodiesterase (GGDEF & EAL domains) with PAS/PAC sensor [Sulfurimonas gotlandica GD1]|jgi:diguanylate cyclase (GGDEF)-like protein/PAS domain S-box-containing protein|uniref:Diguanylate cyclase/phosphodiesterase (GGDEF & EAL domains) with PAS/PAC sensor n=1 Tax=Sulfurimonas gotlandica (strain DSM 19862 / JCM 16533 / GD1) TaxID=929558 RepID=B6BIN6_SULGG|nr:EAL domain-containing protein [Sulfurimonas gotlandica]EDZ63196.1 response regulator receiver [Sulfurimonas gotlandica GD1]EHP30393.1 diguanylate cyclase/phosphodiesterase (GGDEF & EAL domains) with PAS/PAC sensor [Sulfurimonas gotlandica GD1]
MNQDTKLLKNIKLLYVEDNDDVRESTLEILEYYFKDITIARDGEEGFELYEKSYQATNSYFHIVVSDIEMPKMNGVDMCKKIKEINTDQLLVLLTAHDSQEYLMEAINTGIDRFITKPVISVDDLINPLIDLSKKIMLEAEFNKRDFLLKQKNRIIDENIFMTVSDLNGKIIDISQAYMNFTGYTRDEVIGKNHSIFRNEGANPDIIKNLWATILADKEWTGKLKNNKYTGEEYWISSTISPLYDINHKKIGYTAIVQDITNTKRLESLSITDALTEIHNRRYFDYSLKREFKSAIWRKEKFGLLIIDVDFFKDYNDFYGHVKGDKVLKMVATEIKKNISDSVEDVFRIGGEEFAVFISDATDKEVEKIALELITNVELLEIEHEKSSVSKFITISIGAVNIDGSENIMSNEDLYNLADNNLYKAKEGGRNRVVYNVNTSSINTLKNLDVITKLPNRQSLIHDLSLIQEEAMLVLLHINQINSIKDLYGIEAVGDMVSQKAKQLSQIIIDDNVTLYSLNMQEFAILVTSRILFDKYLALLKYSILTNSDENIYYADDENYLVPDFTAGVSYGMLNIFNQADIVLQEAIMAKKNLIIYKNNQTTLELQKSTLNRLRVYKKALHSGNIIPYFQPIIDVRDNSILKYEALARLLTDTGEIVTPYYFLDSAKQDNTFEFFTRQMMQKVFNIYAKKKTDISINITYENINSESMQAYIKNRLEKYGGDGITFEIVESEDIEDYELIEDFILMLKEYNCKVSIDDFGSGYSNFTNIIKLNIDYIKLDGSLIEKLNIDKNVEHMITALLSFAKNAGIKTIAEFVSTKELDKKVRELGVDYIQGYLYGEPKSAESYDIV